MKAKPHHLEIRAYFDKKYGHTSFSVRVFFADLSDPLITPSSDGYSDQFMLSEALKKLLQLGVVPSHVVRVEESGKLRESVWTLLNELKITYSVIPVARKSDL